MTDQAAFLTHALVATICLVPLGCEQAPGPVQEETSSRVREAPQFVLRDLGDSVMLEWEQVPEGLGLPIPEMVPRPPSRNPLARALSFTPSLPFPSGTTMGVSQGWGGAFSHVGTLYYSIDFNISGSGDRGIHVLSVADGRVVYVHESCGEPDATCNGGWGNVVIIEHGSGEYSKYAHLEQNSVPDNVAVGTTACRGLFIGTVGSTGNSTGSHLHFQMQDGSGLNSQSIPWTHFVETSGIPVVGSSYTSQNAERVVCQTTCCGRIVGPTGETVIDDSDGASCFQKGGTPTYWHSESSGGYLGGPFLWTYATDDPVDNWSKWFLNVRTAGEYEVWAYIPATNATSKQARYKIWHMSQASYSTIDQSANNGKWVKLGVYQFESGCDSAVRLDDNTGENYTTYRRKLATDAVKLVPAVCGECSPGSLQTEGCGNCGERSRTCTASCQWGTWGLCSGEGACAPGSLQTEGCGNCGERSRTCTASCQWGTWGLCSGEGACAPGSLQTEGCGNCGERSRTCSASCQWGTWGLCSGEGACAPGSLQTEGCGNCGERSRTCTAACQWGTWGLCSGEGACSPGSLQIETCGNCGERARTCIENCAWGSWGACEELAPCAAGSLESRACGWCGSQERTCLGCDGWSNWGACIDEGSCEPGTTELCGDCGSRLCINTCQWSVCTGSGFCDDHDCCTDNDICQMDGYCAGSPIRCPSGQVCTPENCECRGCGELPPGGSCSVNLLLRCFGGQLVVYDCAADGNICVVQEDSREAECVCHPSCGPRNCGNDGCGGTCGDCSDGFDCGPSGLCETVGDSCGDGVCDADENCFTCSDDCRCSVEDTNTFSDTGESQNCNECEKNGDVGCQEPNQSWICHYDQRGCLIREYRECQGDETCIEGWCRSVGGSPSGGCSASTSWNGDVAQWPWAIVLALLPILRFRWSIRRRPSVNLPQK